MPHCRPPPVGETGLDWTPHHHHRSQEPSIQAQTRICPFPDASEFQGLGDALAASALRCDVSPSAPCLVLCAVPRLAHSPRRRMASHTPTTTKHHRIRVDGRHREGQGINYTRWHQRYTLVASHDSTRLPFSFLLFSKSLRPPGGANWAETWFYYEGGFLAAFFCW